MKTFVAFFSIASPLFAADFQRDRDLPYATPTNERQTLDVYAPAEGTKHPVVVWIHGGGWRKGDKTGVQEKPRAFVEQGFVFVSINYRFIPQVTLKEMTGDVAKAIRWVHDHAKQYGGDPESMFVMGHSAGAHLAALVCIDERYLRAQGLSLSILKGCVPFDVAVYDAAKQIASVEPTEPRRAASYKETFGDRVESQKELSPATHVASEKNIPPFLILHIGREDARIQSELLAEKLQDAGVSAKVVAAEDKTHASLNTDLGSPGDRPTKSVFAFVHGILNETGGRAAR